MFHRRILVLGIVTVALAGCGGGGNSSVPPPSPTATPNDRPVVTNSTLTYSGNMTESATNNFISDTPVTTTANATVTDVVTTSGTATAPVYTSIETDNGTLRTSSSQTITDVTVSGTTSQVFRATSTSYADTTGGAPGSGTTSMTTYGPNNGELTVVPETGGATFTNDAKQSYVEVDPGQTSALVAPAACPAASGFTIDRQVNSDGTYTQCTAGQNGDGSGTPVYDVATELPGFTGTLQLNSTDGGRLYTFSAPAGTTIPYTYTNEFYTPPHVSAFTSVNWITAAAPVVETDAITANVAAPSGCGAFSGTNETLQTITTTDAVLGTMETRTTATYDLPGTGTVCVAVNDTIGEFYDYTETTAPSRLVSTPVATTPVQQIALSEVVGLSAIDAAAAKARASAGSAQTAFIPRTLVTEGVTRFLHAEAKRRLANLNLGGLTK